MKQSKAKTIARSRTMKRRQLVAPCERLNSGELAVRERGHRRMGRARQPRCAPSKRQRPRRHPGRTQAAANLAARFELVAAATSGVGRCPGSGWGWLEAAVWDAVEAGSAFVAPRRVREILLRWERDGFPQPRDPGPPRPEPRVCPSAPRRETTSSLRR